MIAWLKPRPRKLPQRAGCKARPEGRKEDLLFWKKEAKNFCYTNGPKF
jgi:hypothetical protein